MTGSSDNFKRSLFVYGETMITTILFGKHRYSCTPIWSPLYRRLKAEMDISKVSVSLWYSGDYICVQL